MKKRLAGLVRSCRNPLEALLVLLIRGYQTLLSPLIPGRCKYHPSCSQYAIDALTQYGVLRGTVLAGWRLLRCNPLSYGGYDPVERQTLFHRKEPGRKMGRNTGGEAVGASLSRVSSRMRVGLPVLVVVVAVLLLVVSLTTTSCSLIETTTTTVAPAGVDTTVGGETTSTTVEEQRQPGQIDKISKPLQALFFAVLEFFHDKLHVSWSWAIVLLTVVVRIVLLPLMWRQMKSMRAMQALQPQIKALQDKYRDNRELLNQKMMEFYSQNNVSPFSSCLPLLLQMPVFLGLFYMLRTAGRAGVDPAEWGRWAGVFTDPQVGWLWISDITKFSVTLMFLYIASQFLASWQMARKAGGQQKIIAYIMPAVVGIFMFMYKWPAGLMIYWFTSNLWTIAQQSAAEKIIPVPALVGVASEKEKKQSERPTGKGRPPQTGKARPAASGKPPAKKAGGKAPAASGKRPTVKSGGKPPAASTKKTPSAGGAKGGSGGKSGGKSSGQKTGQQSKTTGGKGKRPDRGTGRPKGSGGA
ncbi:MAG: membrane protein insertion efficiency factor YidD [Actinobacteria bacterium]|nr:membrane protein insertion efficiency factor YidD [Actinomycetota bacterium]